MFLIVKEMAVKKQAERPADVVSRGQLQRKVKRRDLYSKRQGRAIQELGGAVCMIST